MMRRFNMFRATGYLGKGQVEAGRISEKDLSLEDLLGQCDSLCFEIGDLERGAIRLCGEIELAFMQNNLLACSIHSNALKRMLVVLRNLYAGHRETEELYFGIMRDDRIATKPERRDIKPFPVVPCKFFKISVSSQKILRSTWTFHDSSMETPAQLLAAFIRDNDPDLSHRREEEGAEQSNKS